MLLLVSWLCTGAALGLISMSRESTSIEEEEIKPGFDLYCETQHLDYDIPECGNIIEIGLLISLNPYTIIHSIYSVKSKSDKFIKTSNIYC